MTDRDPSDTARPQPPSVLRTLGLLHGELRARHGLSLHDYLVLGALAEAEAEADGRSGAGPVPVPVARLAALLGESGNRMSFVLKGLQKAGLVERDRRAGDRRTVEVTLTDVGRAGFTDAESSAQALLRRHPVASGRGAGAGAPPVTPPSAVPDAAASPGSPSPVCRCG
ncbi:MarR family winged helix-turn-helix transcriptional regulator [Streptomyces sp. NPDC094038]|uniref:MarR family winged helix-turn-helix transcriptional regulator n=1 Tax=Streptomyces sp. NPDC094038 TaxID=3366055 RepID=UPI00380606C7